MQSAAGLLAARVAARIFRVTGDAAFVSRDPRVAGERHLGHAAAR
jgi:hypothetical protein